MRSAGPSLTRSRRLETGDTERTVLTTPTSSCTLPPASRPPDFENRKASRLVSSPGRPRRKAGQRQSRQTRTVRRSCAIWTSVYGQK
ncbi:unnamed protein product [Knipowitschia caucasica]|uniref:Uncharacterized protein n=1 Tax=Knipowitschia caucasica TaxID=637954 RepID=A0AAV2MJZ9_KNICA